MEVSKQQEARNMAGTGIAPHVSPDQAEAFIATLAFDGDERDVNVLRAVTLDVAGHAIGAAVGKVGQPTEVGVALVGAEAARWLVSKYVREDFCGLCGRVKDHRGDH